MSLLGSSSVVFSSSICFQHTGVNERTFVQKSSASVRHVSKIDRLGLLGVLSKNCAPESELARCRAEMCHESGVLWKSSTVWPTWAICARGRTPPQESPFPFMSAHEKNFSSPGPRPLPRNNSSYHPDNPRRHESQLSTALVTSAVSQICPFPSAVTRLHTHQ